MANLRLCRSLFHKKTTPNIIIYRYLYRQGYSAPGEELGNYPYHRKLIPKQGQLKFIDQIEDLREKYFPSGILEHEGIDIGLPPPKLETAKKPDTTSLNKDKELESLHRKLLIPLDEVSTAFQFDQGPSIIKRAADHYGIYRDLFGYPHYFYPYIPLNIYYNCVENPDMVNPVCYGNLLSPAEAGSKPFVSIGGEENQFYSLLLTSLDSNYDVDSEPNEVLHWFVSNMSSSSDKIEEIAQYLPPIPALGTGYHRLTFVLLHQTNGFMESPASSLNLETLSVDSPLQKRSWSTKAWYTNVQDLVTPAGLAFFQTKWDSSVQSTFHSVLDIPQPGFQHLPPLELPRAEEEFPFAKSFNQYRDTYRDKKDIAEEVLLDRLANSTLTGEPLVPQPPYPMAEPMSLPSEEGGNTSDWYIQRMTQRAGRRGYWSGLEPELHSEEELKELEKLKS